MDAALVVVGALFLVGDGAARLAGGAEATEVSVETLAGLTTAHNEIKERKSHMS